MTIERFDDGEVQPDVIAFDHEGVEPGEPGDDGPEHRAAARKIPNADQRPTKPPDRWRELVVLAQDPTVKIGGRAIRAKVRVPREDLMPGPRGHRFQVVDFDATNPARLENQVIDDAVPQDAWLTVDDAALVESAAFRAQNVYATAARTLDTFEQALGRRVPWSHAGHQLFLVPKAFREANAFYDPDAHAIFFGYFDLPDGGWAYTSLSHDIVAHETTHAVLDGLRSRFQEPGLPDQAAFHEAFADIVALLSVFSMPEVVAAILRGGTLDQLVAADRLTPDALAASPLLGLGEQLGVALGSYGAAQRGSALRTSVSLKPGTGWIDDPDWEEPHLRGEILVAAVAKAFVAMWVGRLAKIRGDGKNVNVDVAVEEGAKAAEHLLRMSIRAIDYSPPLEFLFADFLDAILVSDQELAPDDEHHYRDALRSSFEAFGILQPRGQITTVGTPGKRLRYSALHADELRTSPDEIYRFIWDNVGLLGIPTDQYLEVDSIWSSTHVGPDGFVIREVVATYVQMLEATAGELGRIAKARKGSFDATGFDAATPVKIFGGGALIFDQWGRPKYHQAKPLFDWDRQKARLEYLVRSGTVDRQGRLGFGTPLPGGQRFAALHAPGTNLEEAW